MIVSVYYVGLFVIVFTYNFISSALMFLFESDIPPLPEMISISWQQSGKKNTIHWALFYYYPYLFKTTYKSVMKIGAVTILGSCLLSYYLQQSESGIQLAIKTGILVVESLGGQIK